MEVLEDVEVVLVEDVEVVLVDEVLDVLVEELDVTGQLDVFVDVVTVLP